MTTLIKNTDTIEPGTLVRGARGKVVFEVIVAEKRPYSLQKWLMGKLRDTRTGRSVGWKYLDTMIRCDENGVEVSA